MKLIRAIVSCVLVSLILVSSTSFSVSMHLCCGHVHDFAILGEAAPCGMEKFSQESREAAACPSGQTTIDRNSCCETVQTFFVGNQYQYKAHKPLHIPTITPCIPRFSESIFACNDGAIHFSPPLYYTPPLISRSTPAFVQSFRL